MSDEVEYNKQFFKFNLLPKKTEEEIKVLVERDNSILYALLLVFAAVFVFFVLSVIDTLIIKARINFVEGVTTQTEDRIAQFDDSRAIHGELIRKANLLIDPLSQDIELTRLFQIAQEIAGTDGVIISYAREQTGEFIVIIDAENVERSNAIIRRAKLLESIENVFAERISIETNSDSQRASLSLKFDIKNI